MPLPFGPHTLVVAMNSEQVEVVQRATAAGCPALAGVRLMVLYKLKLDERPRSTWGDAFVAVSMPREMFVEVTRAFSNLDGTSDIEHFVVPRLVPVARDFLDGVE